MTELYRHFDADGVLLYVGVSVSTVQRVAGHRSVSSWFSQIATITIERFSTRLDALKAETSAIQTEKPLYNIYGTEEYAGLAREQCHDVDLLTATETARLIGISTTTLRKWAANKDDFPVKPVKWVNPLRFRPADVEAFVAGAA